MAWTTPATAVAGSTALTAAFWNEQVRDNALMGRAVYANEAARDAAIPSPEEGMICYLTAPTVPAATGETTLVPSGITTIYNGSAWVCTTSVGAYTSTNGTRATNSFGALSGGGTNPTVTLSTGTTALVLFHLSSYGTNGNDAQAAVSVSGASTIAATATYGVEIYYPALNRAITYAHAMIIDGLTAGTNTFTLEYYATSGTANFRRRRITVQGIA